MTVAELRAEFPPCDLSFVVKHHPDALRIAQTYNGRRAEIDPADATTVQRARDAKARLLDATNQGDTATR